ncbi:alkene reductase [Sansalvadorimonas verongulae]|nr:alkene reductase [Sansalvadorimonas verongulae]
MNGWEWNTHNPETLFGGGAIGLTDYSFYEQSPQHKDTNSDHAVTRCNSSCATLFDPIKHGHFSLDNRVAMAPMTRSRTDQPGDVPNALMATYYEQRASAGLIITEGAPISAVARGYSLTPGIYTKAHIDGWKLTTDAVHQKGGKVFIQLWHVGRRSHTDIAGETPVSASAVKDPDQVYGPLPDGSFGMVETSTPRAMTEDDIQSTIEDFVQAAKNAMDAGFDGVEIHGAHGYLIDQFLRIHSNQRTDKYGGSQENRMRFLVEVMQAVVDAIGGSRVAIRLSPFVTSGYPEDDPEVAELTLKALEALAPMNLAYLHFSENISSYQAMPESFRQRAREVYPNPIMVAGKYTKESGQDILDKGYADIVAFGQPFITNPDFFYRIQKDIDLTPVEDSAHITFYGGGERGYTDYPMAEQLL